MSLLGLLAGSIFGAGLLAVVRGVVPGHPPLAAALASIDRTRPSAGELQARWSTLGRALISLLEGGGFDLGTTRRDLQVVDRRLERHALDKLTVSVSFGALTIATGTAIGAAGISVSPPWLLFTAAIAAAGGFFVPDLNLRREAERRRREFRHALGAFLELVAIVVAGGGGVETALDEAAAVGDGWAFTQIQRTLGGCRLSGESPWRAFDRLGRELGVDDLRELAAAVGLAGEHGARIRSSLAAKAGALRDHRLAEVETDAQAATERMSVPVVLMLFGFISFVLYPALHFVLEGL